MTNSDETLIRFNSSQLPNNFVALAAMVVEGTCTHAGILIRHQGANYLCHYPGSELPEVVSLVSEDPIYVYKIWKGIRTNEESEAGSFLQHCRRVCSRSDITYSFVLDRSNYDLEGFFVANDGLPELGTCVGFCVKVLTSYLVHADSYFFLDDWDETEIPVYYGAMYDQRVIQRFPEIDWDTYATFRKRITPLEYLSSAFLDGHPISKVAIEGIRSEVVRYISNLVGEHPPAQPALP